VSHGTGKKATFSLSSMTTSGERYANQRIAAKSRIQTNASSSFVSIVNARSRRIEEKEKDKENEE
jgi:hypothetical protein